MQDGKKPFVLQYGGEQKFYVPPKIPNDFQSQLFYLQRHPELFFSQKLFTEAVILFIETIEMSGSENEFTWLSL